MANLLDLSDDTELQVFVSQFFGTHYDGLWATLASSLAPRGVEDALEWGNNEPLPRYYGTAPAGSSSQKGNYRRKMRHLARWHSCAWGTNTASHRITTSRGCVQDIWCNMQDQLLARDMSMFLTRNARALC